MNDNFQRKVVIIIDLEGTLCDNRHRVDLWLAQEYEEYEHACGNDKPYEDVVELLKSFCEDNDWVIPVVITDRSEFFYAHTLAWLSQHVPVERLPLFMRPVIDIPKTKEAELKISLFEKMKAEMELPPGTVFIALDDKDEVVEAYRNAGVHCWQVRNGAIS